MKKKKVRKVPRQTPPSVEEEYACVGSASTNDGTGKKKKLKGGEDNRGRSECEKPLLPPLKGEKKNGKGSEGSKTKVLLSTHIQTL